MERDSYNVRGNTRLHAIRSAVPSGLPKLMTRNSATSDFVSVGGHIDRPQFGVFCVLEVGQTSVGKQELEPAEVKTTAAT